MSFVSSSVKREKESVSESFSCEIRVVFVTQQRGRFKKCRFGLHRGKCPKSNRTSASKAKTVSLCISSILYAA